MSVSELRNGYAVATEFALTRKLAEQPCREFCVAKLGSPRLRGHSFPNGMLQNHLRFAPHLRYNKIMRFTSTRDKSIRIGFAEAVLDCMPRDGGLYVPAETEDLRRWILYTNEKTTFASIAGALGSAFIKNEFSPIVCETIATKAFPFEPHLRALDEHHFMLELFHGPSGCHRDFGIAYLCACLETILQLQGGKATILAVTRHEVGAVLAHELRDKKNIKAVVVYPEGEVSGMSESDFSWNGGNVCPVEVEGGADACHAFVREIFADREFVKAHRITAASTANIGRLLPQTFFYPFAFSRLKGKIDGDIYYALAPGNYSNVVAGLYSWQFALPVNGFFIPASDALDVNDEGLCTLAPSFAERIKNAPADPTDPSNIERLEEVFGANERMMRHFLYPVKISGDEVDAAVRELYVKYGVYADRHTGRAYTAAKAKRAMLSVDEGSVVIVALDHPSLSADYIRSVLGTAPETPENVSAVMRPVALPTKPIRELSELRRIVEEINN